ncbi:DNA-dependent ATPase MGS1 [Spathaspora sp. JA1]|nr:DNA-dependent ATPase MGS1 [Spathaspora sp. JA1]
MIHDDEDKMSQSNRIQLDLSLVEAVRPKSLQEYIGQQHLVNRRDGAITNFINLGYLPSMILFGPPGVGKTTLASIIANKCDYVFVELSATDATISQLRDLSSSIANENAERIHTGDDLLRILVFIDEIHRFSKVQQDFLLPFIEDGNFVFIGATTFNPEKRIRPAILSRCQLFRLNELSSQEMRQVLDRAIEYENLKRTVVYGRGNIVYDENSLEGLIKRANGDSRTAINLIELVSSNCKNSEDQNIELSELESIFKSLKYAQSNSLAVPENREIVSRLLSCLKVNRKVRRKTNDEDLEFFYDDFKSRSLSCEDPNFEYLHQMQVSDDSDIESGEIFTDEEENINIDKLDTVKVSANFYVKLLLKRGESISYIVRLLIRFAILNLEIRTNTMPKLMSFVKLLKNTNPKQDNVDYILANFIEWIIDQPKTKSKLVVHMKELKDYFSLNQSQEIENTDDWSKILEEIMISFNQSEVDELEHRPIFEDSNIDQNPGIVVSYVEEQDLDIGIP